MGASEVAGASLTQQAPLARSPVLGAMAGGCAIFCAVNAAVGVPFLAYLGILCSTGAVQVAIPDSDKPEAAQGCFAAAAMYALTFFLAIMCYKSAIAKAASAREVEVDCSSSRVAVSLVNR